MRTPKPEPDPERPHEPAEWTRARTLIEQYVKQFGEHPATFGQIDDDDLGRIAQAIKTGRKIQPQVPPGCDA